MQTNKSDLFLKISVLSFQVFMKTSSSEGMSGLHVITKEIEKVLEQLKKENISAKLKKVLQENLVFNKIITLLYRNKFADAMPLINELKYDENSLLMKFFTFLKGKNIKEIEKLTNDSKNLNSLNLGEILGQLMLLHTYTNFNMTKKFGECFKVFFEKYFLSQQKLEPSQRFVGEKCFSLFSQGIVQHIFKNSNLLHELKDHISSIVNMLDDSEMLHSIAENFAKKDNIEVAHSIYEKILEKFAGDEKANRKFMFYQAFKDPKKVRVEDLPPLELVTDYNKMRSIEMDYLQYKGANAAMKMEVQKDEKTKKIKKRVRKIKWPKAFDPWKHNQNAPDHERWLPKLERKQFARLAKKAGYQKGTQGNANVSETQTKNTFQQGPSTANIGEATGKTKKNTKRGRKK